MDGNRVLYASQNPIETKNNHPVGKYEVVVHSRQFEALLHESTGNNNEFWYHDPKTNSIRNAANGEHCLNWDHTNKALASGVKAVVRPCGYSIDDKETQGLRYAKETYSISADLNSKICLSTTKGTNDDEANVSFETCDAKNKSQGWFPMYRYQSSGPHWNRLQNE